MFPENEKNDVFVKKFFGNKSFLTLKFAVSNEHDSKLVKFAVKIIRSDLIKLQTDLLDIILLLLGLFHVTLGCFIHLSSKV